MSGIDPHHFLAHVIRPTLARIELGGKAAETLLLGTALVESNLTYLKQIGDGPALGVFLMKPSTYFDIYEHVLGYKSRTLLKARVQTLCATPPPHVDQLKWNMAYAAAMCRVQYWRWPAALPPATSAPGLAAYHKKFYNTTEGETNVAHSVEKFEKAIRIVG